nr:cuticle protein AMP1A-like [Penaeus vannamei]
MKILKIDLRPGVGECGGHGEHVAGGLVPPWSAAKVILTGTPSGESRDPILKDDRSQDAYGGYSFSYGTGNGIYRDEVGRQNYGQVTQGGWSYTSPEGVPVKITFVADQGGYQPSGNVLPVAPALPYSRTQVY